MGQIRPGESVGEMGLLASQPRSATVQASRDSVVVRISEEAFRQVVAEHPQLVASTARLVIRRTTELMRGAAPIERAKNIAILPLRRSVRCADFVERLRKALERRGPTLVVDRARAEGVLAANGISHSRGDDARSLVLSRWLDEQELRHDALLFPTERSSTPTSAASRTETAMDLAASSCSSTLAARARLSGPVSPSQASFPPS